MSELRIIEILNALADGSKSVAEVSELLSLAPQAMAEVTLDLDRIDRCGFPEVVYGENKSAETIVEIFEALRNANQPLLATRVTAEKAGEICSQLSDVSYNAVARTIRSTESNLQLNGIVAVVSAGTSDLPVATECIETLRWMGVEPLVMHDIGVAGPERLLQNVDCLRTADVVIVVAGMEGALPSVVGGHVDVPVIAVPTSVGYGAALGGMAALLGMLNSCASNVTVVNIDAGFKAAFVAGTFVRQLSRCLDASPTSVLPPNDEN